MFFLSKVYSRQKGIFIIEIKFVPAHYVVCSGVYLFLQSLCNSIQAQQQELLAQEQAKQLEAEAREQARLLECAAKEREVRIQLEIARTRRENNDLLIRRGSSSGSSSSKGGDSKHGKNGKKDKGRESEEVPVKQNAFFMARPSTCSSSGSSALHGSHSHSSATSGTGGGSSDLLGSDSDHMSAMQLQVN